MPDKQKLVWRIGIYIIWVLLTGSTQLYGQSLLDQPLSLSPSSGTIGSYLSLIQAQTGIVFSYNPNQLHLQRNIRLTGRESSLREYLETILKDEAVIWIERNGKILLKPHKKDTSVLSIEQERPPLSFFTVSGYVRELISEEALIGASVRWRSGKAGTHTNVHGYYSLTLPAGKQAVQFSYVGYKSLIQEMDLRSDLRRDIFLEPSFELEEVVIAASSESTVNEMNSTDAFEVPIEKVQTLPLLMGEKDLLKTIQLLPGVQSGGEGLGGLHVRGGGPDQNLIMMDGVPIYNTSHLMGLVSVFYGDAIKRASIIKSGFPARYGGRLSSVVDVRMKEGNKEQIHGELSVGTLSGTLNLEGPIIKEKTSFHLSARRTWLDAITVPLMRSLQKGPGRVLAGYNFSDLNLKFHHKLSQNDQLFLSGYLGLDKLFAEGNGLLQVDQLGKDFEALFRLRWGNRMGALKWTRLWGSKWFSTSTLTYTAYRYGYQQYVNIDPHPENPADTVEQEVFSFSHINDWALRTDVDYYPNPRHVIKMGASLTAHVYTPQYSQSRFNKPPLPDSILDISPGKLASEFLTRAYEWAVYFEDQIKWTDHLNLHFGVHAALFTVQGKTYSSLQARISMQHQFNPYHSLIFSYSRMTQFIHLLTQPGLGFPSDLWVPSTRKIAPEHAHHGALGYVWECRKGWKFRTEVYGKWMDNLLEYEDGAAFFSDDEMWEDRVAIGQGWSYGWENMIEKSLGKTTGWIAYTLSRTLRRFDQINRGVAYPYRYDRRHDISIAISHKINDRIDLGLVWVYGSGHALTLGLEKYLSLDAAQLSAANPADMFPLYFTSSTQIPHLEKRNNYRAPAYHRLDLAVNLHKQKKRGLRSWNLGLYNAYNRKNPYTLFLREDPGTGKFSLRKISLLPLLPFVGYRFKF